MHSQLLSEENFEEEDYEFFLYNFTGPRKERYRKCPCGKHYEGKEKYCSEECKSKKPSVSTWWLSEGRVWRRTEKGIEEVV